MMTEDLPRSAKGVEERKDDVSAQVTAKQKTKKQKKKKRVHGERGMRNEKVIRANMLFIAHCSLLIQKAHALRPGLGPSRRPSVS